MLYNVGMAFKNRLSEARGRAGFTQAQLGEALGVTSQAVSQWENGHTVPELDKIPIIARKLGVSEGWLLSDTEDASASEAPARFVRVVGYVGAGAEAHFYKVSQGDLDEVPAPTWASESTVAVEIRGDSLGKTFDRWLAYYDDVRRPVMADQLGRLCVVGLETGQILLKKIRAGSRLGRFRLESENAEPIQDAVLEWAAVVKHIEPRS